MVSVMRVDDWIERLARLGYIAKGVVYVLVGILALTARSADRGNGIELINSKPFGKFALVIIALGLLGYAAWRVISGINDAEQPGRCEGSRSSRGKHRSRILLRGGAIPQMGQKPGASRRISGCIGQV